MDTNIYAEGCISDDTIYEGSINFTDKISGDLLSRSYFKNGILNGITEEFYKNGIIKSSGNYENGKMNGYTFFYDSTGNLVRQQNTYYDLPVGPRIDFKDGNPSTFGFYSLEKRLLFYLDYDSVYGKRITDLQESYFFLNKQEYALNDKVSQEKEYFMYTMNPPKYDFNYELVKVDSSMQIKEIKLKINNNKPWTFFALKSNNQSNELNAIRLTIYDSINNERATLMKRLW